MDSDSRNVNIESDSDISSHRSKTADVSQPRPQSLSKQTYKSLQSPDRDIEDVNSELSSSFHNVAPIEYLTYDQAMAKVCSKPCDKF